MRAIREALKAMFSINKTIWLRKYKESACSQIDHDEIISLIDNHIKSIEFDSAIVLMEKQRLKKLEIKELELRLALLDIKRTKESPLPSSFQGELL